MKKLRLRTPFKILLSLILIAIIVVLYFPVSSVYKLMELNYSFDSSLYIYKNNLYDEFIDKEYSDILNIVLEDENFDIERMNIYRDIKYLDREDFLININKFLDLKYSIDEINLIYERVSDDFLQSVVLKEYVYDIADYVEVDIFKEEYLDRYRRYFNGNYNKTVLYVNIGLDKEYYSDPVIVSEYSTTMLINKYNKLDDSFIVPNLTKISDEYSSGENYLAEEAALAFENMARDAKSQGYDILANSSYRTVDDQQELWDLYLGLYGIGYNNRYVTKPGFSEHHTGLALDIKSKNSNIFKNSKEYTWMLENGYKYGFIHRYQEKKVDITGISSEAWHFRYVGVEAAKYIYENNLCLEEYYALVVEK